MFVEQILRIIVTIIGLVIAAWWLLPLGHLAWFHPDNFEKMMSERAKYHPLNAYNPKYNWKAIVWMWRVFSLVATLAMLAVALELLLGLISLIL